MLRELQFRRDDGNNLNSRRGQEGSKRDKKNITSLRKLNVSSSFLFPLLLLIRKHGKRPNQTTELSRCFRWTFTTSTFLERKQEYRAKPNRVCLSLSSWLLLFEFVVFPFFQFMYKFIHIYIPLYFCLHLLFWFYI